VGQQSASEERTVPARHPGGREGERLRDNVGRSATLSSAPQASPPQQLLFSLQQTAGNRAVRGLIQRLREESGQARLPQAALASRQRLIQRALWENVPADFRTDNETGGKIPNSEYSVVETSFRRYAPINEIRHPGQVYHEGPRSLAYIRPGDGGKAASETESATVEDGNISLRNGDQRIGAVRKPQTGLTVWDGEVDDKGKVKTEDVHVGHAVQNLGGKLPTLGDAAKWQKVRSGQPSVKAAQEAWAMPSDDELNKLMEEIMEKQDISMADAIVEMRNDPDILGPIAKARRPSAPLEYDKTQRYKRLLQVVKATDRARGRLLADRPKPKPPEDKGETVEEMLGSPQGASATEHGRDQPADDATADGEQETPEGPLSDLSSLEAILEALNTVEAAESKDGSATEPQSSS
jgi:hypothetical protein